MIREWRISRFKSIAGTESLRFRPLTILAGPNSSGKSSVIQSILLVAQSLASRVPNRQLVLNGEFVKLGTFEDVLNQQADEQSVDFGFDIDLDCGSGDQTIVGDARATRYPPFFRPMVADIPRMTVSGDITFGPAGDPGADVSSRPLQADVKTASFRTTVQGQQAILFAGDEVQTAEPDVVIERRTDVQVAQLLSKIDVAPSLEPVSGLRQALRYDIHLSARAKQALRRGRRALPGHSVPGEIVSARLEHFLPATVVWRQRSFERIVSSNIFRLSVMGSASLDATLERWRVSAQPVHAAMATVVKEMAEASGENIARFVRALRSDPDRIDAILAQTQEIVGEPWTSAVSAVEGSLPEEQALAFRAIHAFFDDMRYLGPLRDDPKPLYEMSEVVDPTDIGSKGQYTAAVLYENDRAEIDFIPPGESASTRATLGEAIRIWLQHFGMADAIRTTDEPKLGHRLLVRPTGIRRYVDLTNVGVGVSQVLPILVMALVSRPGSVLLFEQPELHLHPAIQSQLGDFFIALARSGRQCVVETHSEYLINRLRLRIAESELDSDLLDLSVVHFVERPGAASKFTPVVINAFGAIPDWPRGFFDQSPTESELILRAAMKKKAAISGKDKSTA